MANPDRIILIVDDSPTIRRMVRVALGDIEALTFAEAGTGLEAIERLSLSSIALMVLDLNMPDMHGLEVLAFVRRHPKYAKLPVIVLTTRGDDDSRAAAERAGATVYLTKPFSAQVVSERVRELLDTARTCAREEERRAGR
jgi:two-component system chemotaxis response regulator CheY